MYVCIITPHTPFFHHAPTKQLPQEAQLGTSHTKTDHKVGLSPDKELRIRSQPDAAPTHPSPKLLGFHITQSSLL